MRKTLDVDKIVEGNIRIRDLFFGVKKERTAYRQWWREEHTKWAKLLVEGKSFREISHAFRGYRTEQECEIRLRMVQRDPQVFRKKASCDDELKAVDYAVRLLKEEKAKTIVKEVIGEEEGKEHKGGDQQCVSSGCRIENDAIRAKDLR